MPHHPIQSHIRILGSLVTATLPQSLRRLDKTGASSRQGLSLPGKRAKTSLNEAFNEAIAVSQAASKQAITVLIATIVVNILVACAGFIFFDYLKKRLDGVPEFSPSNRAAD